MEKLLDWTENEDRQAENNHIRCVMLSERTFLSHLARIDFISVSLALKCVISTDEFAVLLLVDTEAEAAPLARLRRTWGMCGTIDIS